MKIITEDQLRVKTPSVFSTEAHEKTTSKYAVIPTIECIRGLEKSGYYPVQATESRCRNAENKAFVKHMIRFRNMNTVEVGGNVPEIVMVNSHNGTSSYQLRAGIYRLVCSNGMIVGNELFHRSVRHQGDVISKVVEAATDLTELLPEVNLIADHWKGITLNAEHRRIYSESASLLKWDQDENIVESHKLLNPRRHADTGADLWSTFNTIQENMIRGGVRYRNSLTYRRGTTREVKSVNENMRLNTALWNLTEKMALLVA